MKYLDNLLYYPMEKALKGKWRETAKGKNFRKKKMEMYLGKLLKLFGLF